MPDPVRSCRCQRASATVELLRRAGLPLSRITLIEQASSTCAAEVTAIHATWAEHPDGYAAAATPVTSAQV
jgi:hypothetical protein